MPMRDKPRWEIIHGDSLTKVYMITKDDWKALKQK